MYVGYYIPGLFVVWRISPLPPTTFTTSPRGDIANHLNIVSELLESHAASVDIALQNPYGLISSFDQVAYALRK